MKIQVTQEHINKGAPGSGALCPITLAATDAGLTNVYTDPGGLEYHWPTAYSLCRDPLPIIALDFMQDFDNNHPVTPFAFDIPGPALK